MSKEFIESAVNSSEIYKARRQQQQINHFTISSIQEDISKEYIEQWAMRNFRGSDYFLTFVKTLFKTENFLSFFKYLRYPLASSLLIQEVVIPELHRVFHADDAYFEYYIKGEKQNKIDELETNKFTEKLFNALMSRFNDVIVTRIDGSGELKRDFISIDKVVSIEFDEEKEHIKKIAYIGFLDGIEGHIYIDNEIYAFYPDKEEEHEIIIVEHGIGETPVDFVSPKPFNNTKEPIVRYSIFSNVREELENLVFLKTLQKMVEPNGVIPVVTMLQTKNDTEDEDQSHGANSENPQNLLMASGQRAKIQKEVLGEGSIFQAGTITELPMIRLDSGGIDMEVVKNFVNFHHTPVEPMEYIKKRIDETEKSIIRKLVGDYSEANESAKNEKQVSKSYISKQDKLRLLSEMITRSTESVERKSLKLLYGVDKVDINIFFGSDFFIESKEEVYRMIEKSPNPIEKKNLLTRLSNINNKFNKSKAKKERILYLILPFSTDKDFEYASNKGNISNEIFELYTRFSYWIGVFETTYGSVTSFWESMGDVSEEEKIVGINSLITDIIKSNTVNNSSNNINSRE